MAMQKIVGDGTFIPPSDHDPLGLELDFSHLVQPNLIAVLSHAESLGQTFVKDQSVSRRPLNMRNIDVGELERLLGDPEDICLQSDTVDACFKELSDHVYDICKQAKSPNRAIPKTSNKWEYVTNNNDPKALWAAIGWNGSVLAASEETPSDEEFCNHFEDLLYPHPSDVDTLDVSDAPNIPVLDDPISQLEFENAVGKCKPNKCAGNDGIPPGVWRVMPVKWKLAILTLFNIVFLYTMYPMEWCYSRLVTIFKKGRTSMCVNYRGIAISDGIIKLFDLIMLNRLKLWYKPRPEQAGAQVGRGCLEQILALRLIISYALTKRAKLWIVYVDFKQAYDRVPRLKLLQELKKKGCGQTFLRIIQAMYSCTKMILKSAIINSSVGVKQGAPMSCLLFVFYIDIMINMINEYGSDGFLGDLHTILLMDDTAILATSMDACKQKLDRLGDYCKAYGMVVNEAKTKFMVINGDSKDKSNIVTEDFNIGYTNHYWYLGSPICDDGKVCSVVDLHVKEKPKQVLKFTSIIRTNCNMPFPLKKNVAEACTTTSFCYGSETWLTGNFKRLESPYGKLVRLLLCIPMDLCLFEASMPCIKEMILSRRKTFL